MSDVTQILSQLERGEAVDSERLLSLVYDELRRLAEARLAHEKPGQTLQATALVHEAYVRLVDVEKIQQWKSRGHFFGAAAEAMRRILVDNARRKQTLKRGGGWQRQPLEEAAVPEADAELVALDAALVKLAQTDPQKAKLVELRYFAGLTGDQAATMLGISSTTADRHWAYARAWLHAEISGR
jgi:RNA polymerase sigma factor (TIGR02999 family)